MSEAQTAAKGEGNTLADLLGLEQHQIDESLRVCQQLLAQAFAPRLNACETTRDQIPVALGGMMAAVAVFRSTDATAIAIVEIAAAIAATLDVEKVPCAEL